MSQLQGQQNSWVSHPRDLQIAEPQLLLEWSLSTTTIAEINSNIQRTETKNMDQCAKGKKNKERFQNGTYSKIALYVSCV